MIPKGLFWLEWQNNSVDIGCFAAVSPQFLIVHYKRKYHANLSTVIHFFPVMVLKSGTSASL